MRKKETKKMTVKAEVIKPKTLYIVDRYNKRRIKKSVPTEVLNFIEKKPLSSIKDIENSLIKRINVKTAYNKALKKALAIGRNPFKIREFTRRRIIAVIRYYTNKSVIDNEFNGLYPIIKEDVKGIDRYTLGTINA